MTSTCTGLGHVMAKNNVIENADAEEEDGSSLTVKSMVQNLERIAWCCC